MTVIIILIVLVILICSSILGGLVYWKRDDLIDDTVSDLDESSLAPTQAAATQAAANLAAAEASAAAAASPTDAALATQAAAAVAAALAASPAALGESCETNKCESPLVCGATSMICEQAPVTPVTPDEPVFIMKTGHIQSKIGSLSEATLNSLGSGWIQIKYIPGPIPAKWVVDASVSMGRKWVEGSSAKWFPGNDNLLGYGGTEFLFTTGDFSRWLICDQSAVNGELYSGSQRPVTRSSIQDSPHTRLWYNRDPAMYGRGDVDDNPWISLEDFSVSKTSNTIMYKENSSTYFTNSIHSTGMYVFVR